VVTESDLEPGSGDTLEQAAEAVKLRLAEALKALEQQHRWPVLMKGIGLAVVQTLLLGLALWGLWRLADVVLDRLTELRNARAGMARTWALELAEHGITVNVVAPGPILTDNFWGIVPKGSAQEDDLARRIPVGRLGTPQDVTRAFMFLADPDAGFITGQTLFVCGGASIGTVPI